MKAWEKQRKAKRDAAMARPELKLNSDSAARYHSESPTGMALKAVDPETRRLIDEAVAKRKS